MPSPVTVSVIIPAFNRADYIAAAIASILDQTLSDLELIVVDDGSTDDTVETVNAFGDARIRLLRHPSNLGIPKARNTGLRLARGRYIAWLDSDDIARPRRLEEQVRFLNEHLEIAMVGSAAGKCGPDGAPLKGVRVPPLRPDDIRAWLLFRSAFQHSSVTSRAEILKGSPYSEEFEVCEDLDLFIRLARSYPVLNLPQVLIDRRIHPNQTIRLRQAATHERSMRLFGESLDGLGMQFTDEDLRRHIVLGSPKQWGFSPDRDFLDWAEDWLSRLREANAGSGRLDRSALEFATGFFWMTACRAARPEIGRVGADRRFFGSPLMPGLLSSRGRTWLSAVFRTWLSQQRPLARPSPVEAEDGRSQLWPGKAGSHFSECAPDRRPPLAGSARGGRVRAMRILVIEDERDLSGLVEDGLKRAGMQSDVFAKAQDAESALAATGYDAVILDLALPDGRGEELLLRLRRRGDTTPVLILTAEDAVASRIDCLNAGADDYLVKPFDMGELVARVRALLRRPGGALGTVLVAGNMMFDTVGRQVTVDDARLALSRRELSVLEHLMRRAGRVVPKEWLEEKLYDADQGPDSNPIPVHVHNVRRKLGANGATADIRTIRGVGYILHERG